MADKPVGQIIDALGVQVGLEEGDLPTDAYVVIKIVKADGTVSLLNGRSESLDWITALGMITAAQQIQNSGYADASADDTD